MYPDSSPPPPKDIDLEALSRFKSAFQVDSSSPSSKRSSDREVELAKEDMQLLVRLKSLHEQLLDAQHNEPLMTRKMKVDMLDGFIQKAETRRDEIALELETLKTPVTIPSPPPPPPPPMPTGVVPLPPPPPPMGPPLVVVPIVAVEPVVEEVRHDAPVAEFTELDETFGAGIWKIDAISAYTPTAPVEVPGTGFKVIVPGQDHVNVRIVEAKLEAGLPTNPVIPVVVSRDGTVNIMDKHHTFVAALAIGRGVKLARLKMGFVPKPRKSWAECTWKGFEKPGKAAKGFGLSREESATHEGERQSSGDWRSVVPWRKNTPGTVPGKVSAMKETMSTLELGDALGVAAGVQAGLAERLYEMLTIDRIQVKSRKKAEGSSGGDWDAETQTIYVDDDLDPVAAVDMLVFESLNALHQSEYAALQHTSHQEHMDGHEFGTKKAEIEANVTIEHLEFVIAMRDAGKELAPGAIKMLAAADRRVPGYSTMTASERKQQAATMTELIINTPHGGPDVRLPERLALTTRALYAYEKIADTQNIKGVKGYFREVLPKGNPKYAAFREALNVVPDVAPLDPSYAAKFYQIAATAANALFGTTIPLLTSDQMQVANAEYTKAGGTWEAALREKLEELED